MALQSPTAREVTCGLLLAEGLRYRAIADRLALSPDTVKLHLRALYHKLGVANREALVSRHGFSARYDLNRKTGVFSRESHDLFGQSIVGKILVHTTAKGGVATAWALLDMRAQGTAPLGIIFQLANPIMAQGAALADLPLMDRLDPDPLAVIEPRRAIEAARQLNSTDCRSECLLPRDGHPQRSADRSRSISGKRLQPKIFPRS